VIAIYFKKELFSDIIYFLNKYKNIDVLKDCNKDKEEFQFKWCEQTREERLADFLLNINNHSNDIYISIYIDDNNKYSGYDFGKRQRYKTIYYLNYFHELRKEKIKRVLE